MITDSTGLTATSPVNTLYVDLATPTVTVITETVTLARLTADNAYQFLGTAPRSMTARWSVSKSVWMAAHGRPRSLATASGT